jgi:putative restriction endonuclease
MARLSKQRLFRVVEAAIRDSGWSLARLSNAGGFPSRYEVARGDARHRVRIYIWNVTHGGGKKRAADEYRIQITSGVTQFEPEPGGKTLILGWFATAEALAGWDFSYHTGPLGSSPSMQIKEHALLDAGARGFAVNRKDTGELAVAFQPEFIGTYIDQLEALHAVGKIIKEADVLERVALDPTSVGDTEINSVVAKPRRYAVMTTRRALRDIRFRKRVLEAYGHRCAMCGVQLGLLDAAHIVPVEHPDGTDETSNGVALCALHHRAYDRGLVTFDEKYRIRVSSAQIDDLKASGHHGGGAGFRRNLLATLGAPADRRLWPKPAYIRKANNARGWVP